MTFDPEALRPIGAAEIPARLVCIGQRGADQLRAWAGDVFEAIDVQTYKSGPPVSPLLLDARFEMILLAGHDARRLAAVLRAHEPALRRPFVIAVMIGSTPQTRASLLRTGFDEVLDTTRICALEAIIRLRAMWRRRLAKAEQERERLQQRARLEKVCSGSALTAREKRLIQCLLDKPGWCVPAERLRRVASVTDDPISPLNLRVSMSHLRRKMIAGASIKGLPQEGYMLVYEQQAAMT